MYIVVFGITFSSAFGCQMLHKVTTNILDWFEVAETLKEVVAECGSSSLYGCSSSPTSRQSDADSSRLESMLGIAQHIFSWGYIHCTTAGGPLLCDLGWVV